MNFLIIESGLSRFQNHSFLLHLKALWTWAALIIAAIATFNSLIRRSKRIFLRIREGKSVISLPPPSTYDDEFCSSSDDESDDDGEEEEDELVASSDSEKDFEDFEEIQGENGESGHDFEWPELSRDGSVVKLWDGLGLDLGRSFFLKSDEIQAVHVESPALVLLAGRGSVKVWDGRVGAVSASATWEAEGMGRVVRIGGEDYRKVYVGDDVGRVRVVDLRNVRSSSTESWWYFDSAVTESDGHDGKGLVSWCRSAARCLNLSDSFAC